MEKVRTTELKHPYGCFNLTEIYNKYNGNYETVNCGHCDYCNSLRAKTHIARINREFENQGSNSSFFVLLTYDNDHLPVYKYDYDTLKWRSNRYGRTSPLVEGGIKVERFRDLHNFEVDKFVTPVDYPAHFGGSVFGHLCYPDVDKYFKRVRSKIKYYIKNGKLDITDEQSRIRYYLRGEYGPTTLRPHYHVIVWTSCQLSQGQYDAFRKILLEAWSLGFADSEPPRQSSTASSYVAAYVNSSNNVPKVLRIKPLREFSTFSRLPVLGFKPLNESQIREIYYSGTLKRDRWDDKFKEFVPFPLSFAEASKFFPTPRKFGDESSRYALRVFATLYNYARNTKGLPSLSEVQDLRVSDFDWQMVNEVLNTDYTDEFSVTDWLRLSKYDAFDGYRELTYKDKVSSLACLKYCVMFNTTPEDVFNRFKIIYSKFKLRKLKDFYEYQAENTHLLRYHLSTDARFFDELPTYVERLRRYQYFALDSYGIDVWAIYPDGVLDMDEIDRLSYVNDPVYQRHVAEYGADALSRIKKKKINEYKLGLTINIQNNG